MQIELPLSGSQVSDFLTVLVAHKGFLSPERTSKIRGTDMFEGNVFLWYVADIPEEYAQSFLATLEVMGMEVEKTE